MLSNNRFQENPEQTLVILESVCSCKCSTGVINLWPLKLIPSADITVDALFGKTTHYILAWDLFEGKPLMELFAHFRRQQFLSNSDEKTQTVTLAFKFDVRHR